MKALKIMLAVLLAFVLAGVGYYAHMGGFSTVTVTKVDFASTEIVYATHKGPYQNLSRSWTAFQKNWEAAGLKSCDSLAIYFDAPGTPEEKLRSIIACRIDGLAANDKTKVKTKLPSFQLPASKSLFASFPFKGVFSFFLGPAKVYPEMKRVLSGGKLSHVVAIESYGTMEKIKDITYYMPLETKQADYQKLVDAFKQN